MPRQKEGGTSEQKCICTRAASNGALQKSRHDGRRFRAGAVVRVLGESR